MGRKKWFPQVGKMEADALDIQLTMPVKRGPGRPRKNS